MPIKYVENEYESKDAPLWWHLQGLSQTSSGYGSKLTSSHMIRFHGEKIWRRVYVVQWSNAGSPYVIVKGETQFLSSPTLPKAPVNVNTASAVTLQTLPHVGPKLAQKIIAGRPYKSLADLDKVPGIGPKLLQSLKPLVTF